MKNNDNKATENYDDNFILNDLKKDLENYNSLINSID